MALYGPFGNPGGGSSFFADAPPGAVPLGSGSVTLGFDGVLSATAAALQESTRVQRETLTYMEAMTRFSGRTADAVEVFTKAMGVAPPGRKGSAPQLLHDPVAAALTSETAAEPSRKRQPVPEDDDGQHARMPFHRNPGEKYTLGNLRRDAAAQAGLRMQEMTWGETLVQDKRGNWYPEGVAMNRKANRADPARVEKYLARQSVKKGFQNTLGAISEGQKVGSAIESGFGAAGGRAAQIAGAAGMAVSGGMVAKEAADKVLDFAEGQREANRAWQQILGGSNAEGFGERARSQIAEIKGRFFGGVPTGVTEDAYIGAARIYGKDRNMRGDAYDFAIDMYKKLGLDVSDSLKLVSAAASSNNDNLDLLAKNLKELSKAAEDAGISAEKAREKFEKNFLANTENIGGTQATQVSSLYTSVEESLGRGYEGISFSGALSGSALQMRASSRGMTEAAYRAMVASPGGAAEEAKTVQGMVNQRRGTWLGNDVRAAATQWIQSHGGMDSMTPEKWTALANELSQTTSLRNLSPQQAMDMMSQLGASGMTPDNASGMFLRTLMDGDMFTSAAEEVIGEVGPQPLGNEPVASDDEIERLEAFASGRQSSLTGWKIPTRAEAKQAKTQLAAISAQQTTGMTSPIVDALANSQYDKGRKYKVIDKDGKEIEVNTEELLSKYMDQAVTGNVEISKGEGEGQTVSDYTGKQGTANASEYSNQQTTVRVIPDPSLSRWLQFVTDANANTRGQGVPPRSGNP